ncbi:hypothetical protein [Mesoplasma photuris]|uniref:hypothetical protein n=1 Tax=Mesoplasma photuris TaxID=217731 RepID=UPI0004E1E0CF|nr:hypothetical protein [Mesoplasma photuris]
MDNKKPTLKDLRESQKKVYKQEVAEALDSTYSGLGFNAKILDYRKTKKMKWWSWLIALGASIVATGFSFLMGYAFRSNININVGVDSYYGAAGWTALSIIVALVLAYMIISYIRNKKAEKHFNDKRRRYQRTLTQWEAKVFLAKKIIFLTILLMVAPTVCFMVLL